MKSSEFRDRSVRSDLLQFVPAVLREKAAVFIGGSLVHGYGNEKSDIDIVAVYSGEGSVSPEALTDGVEEVLNGLEIHVGNYRGIRVDLEVIREDLISDIATKLRWGSRAAVVPAYLRVTLNNLRLGVPIVENGEYERLQKAFPWRAYTRALALEAAERFSSTSEDASGGILARDIGPAMMTSRRALETATEAYLAALGCTNTRTKWRIRQLELFGKPQDVDRYLNAQLEPSLDLDSVVSKAKERLRLGQYFLTSAHTALAKAKAESEKEFVGSPRSELVIGGYPNARDMGGLPVGELKTRRDMLFRSGHNGEPEVAKLKEMGVAAIVDLRERDEAIFPVPDGTGITTYAFPTTDYSHQTAADILNLLAGIEGNVLIHCSKGRDRTGMVLASLLAVLGASDDVVARDYMDGVRGWNLHAGVSTGETDGSEEAEFRVVNRGWDAAKVLAEYGLTEESVIQLRRKYLVER